MLLNEFLKENNIMEAIGGLFPLSFTMLDDDELNTMLSINHGNKTFFPQLSDVPINTLSKIIVSRFSGKWTSIKEVMNELDIKAGDYTKIKESISDDNNSENNLTNVNQVSALNSVNLVDNDGNISKTENVGTNLRDREYLETHGNLNNIDSGVILLEKYSLIDVILSDVAEQLTLSIWSK